MKLDKIKKFIKENGLPSYRISQIKECLFKKGVSAWKECSTIPLDLRKKLDKEIPVLCFNAVKVFTSSDGATRKALITLKDGKKIESVLLNPFKDNWSVCVSSQVGCQLACAFCATGKMGFKRNLSAEEIFDQVLFWHQFVNKEKIADRISSIVFMGMGEPLINYLCVREAVENLSGVDGLNIGQRHISISTAGYVPGIRKMTKDLPQVNLAVSLHSAENELRNKLVPLNGVYNLEKLADEIENYLEVTARQVFIEFALIKNVNDTAHHARALAKWLGKIKKSYLICVNLIGCNENGKYQTASPQRISNFAGELERAGIKTTVRKSLGADISGACGQLSAKK